LDDGTVKCWGWNINGQLGLGHKDSVGGGPLQMGDMLPPVALGAGKKPASLALGDYHSCVRFVGGAVQRWGHNLAVHLGNGARIDRGDDPGEMGAALPFALP